MVCDFRSQYVGLDWESLIEWQKPLTTTGLKPVPPDWICMEEAMGEDVNGCVVSLTCRMLSVQLGNFRENIQRMLSSKSLYSWLLGGFFFFFNFLLWAVSVRSAPFVFLCTNLKFPIGNRRLNGSHHITMLLRDKMPSSAASHHQNPGQSLFVEKLLQPVVFLWRCTCAFSTWSGEMKVDSIEVPCRH